MGEPSCSRPLCRSRRVCCCRRRGELLTVGRRQNPLPTSRQALRRMDAFKGEAASPQLRYDLLFLFYPASRASAFRGIDKQDWQCVSPGGSHSSGVRARAPPSGLRAPGTSVVRLNVDSCAVQWWAFTGPSPRCRGWSASWAEADRNASVRAASSWEGDDIFYKRWAYYPNN